MEGVPECAEVSIEQNAYNTQPVDTVANEIQLQAQPNSRKKHTRKKRSVILRPHTIVEGITMVIKSVGALVTLPAMLRKAGH